LIDYYFGFGKPSPPCHGDNRCMKRLFEPPEESRDDEGWLPVVM
jgi:hypothetical protein